MTLKQLIHFKYIYKHKNITKAANELYISQPALTTSLKTLENYLGINLINRSNGKITITEEGEFFYRKSQKILDDYDKLLQEMDDFVDRRNYFKIGIPLQISVVMLPFLFNEFHKIFNDTKIEIVESGALDVIQNVLNENIQIAISAIDKDKYTELLNIYPLFKSKLSFCVSKQHPFAEYKSISFKKAIKEQIITFNDSFFVTQLVRSKCKEIGVKPNILFTTNQMSNMKNSISNNMACSFLIDVSIQEQDNIIAIPLEEELVVEISVFTKKGVHLYKNVKQVLKFIINKYRVIPN